MMFNTTLFLVQFVRLGLAATESNYPSYPPYHRHLKENANETKSIVETRKKLSICPYTCHDSSPNRTSHSTGNAARGGAKYAYVEEVMIWAVGSNFSLSQVRDQVQSDRYKFE
ncbi:hypothetical protein R3P38DRAFT_2763413 [Favolaschia claudopus]|uniref:Uncharacterized protein n=1 Tax=Favolaschia claudopus TaxID=2862362 RepID=A0AAW0DG27_9AGAR